MSTYTISNTLAKVLDNSDDEQLLFIRERDLGHDDCRVKCV